MAKVRVYELAKELGVESKTVLSMLKDMGEFVRSASSTVEAPVERRLKEKLASEPPPVKKAPAKKAAAKKIDGEQVSAAPPAAEVPVEVPAVVERSACRACCASCAGDADSTNNTNDAGRTNDTRDANGSAPTDGGSASGRAQGSGSGCAGGSERRATDCATTPASGIYGRTPWRPRHTPTRHTAAREQSIRTLTGHGPVASTTTWCRWRPH